MLYLMLVVVFSKIKKKWWFFALVGWGKRNLYTIFDCIMILQDTVASVRKLYVNKS